MAQSWDSTMEVLKQRVTKNHPGKIPKYTAVVENGQVTVTAFVDGEVVDSETDTFVPLITNYYGCPNS